MLIHLDPSTGLPIYRQIMDQVKRLVAAGQLAPGQRLDSVRSLARRLAVNPMTVAKAYRLLSTQGVVAARAGLGLFVADTRSELTRQARRRVLADRLDQVVAEAFQLDVSADETLALLRERFSATGPPAAAPGRPRRRPPRRPPVQEAPPPPPIEEEEEEDVSLL